MPKNDEQAKENNDQQNYTLLGGSRRRFGRQLGKEVVKAKNFKGTLKRLWIYVGRERKWLLIVFAIILVDSLFTLLIPYLIGASIDAIADASGIVDFQMLKRRAITLIAVFSADGVLTLFQGWLMAVVSQRIILNMRSALFEKLQKLPIAFFDLHSHGEMMSRLTNDIDNVSGTISQSTTQLMYGTITIIGSFVMMIVLSPYLTLVSIVAVPLVMVLTRIIARKTSILFKEQQAQLGKLNGHVEETISGIQVVKAFNREDNVVAEFDAVNSKLCEVGLKAQIWSGFLMPLMNVINNIGFALIAIAGGILAIKNLITIGIIASFLSYSRQFARPLNDLANIFNLLQAGVAGAERVFEVLDETEEAPDSPNAIPLENSKGHVVFEEVDFGYRPDVHILKSVSFAAGEGSSTALVGPTGAGKTTIANLIIRFYDVTKGRILIDGRDVRSYTRESLRKCFGVVLQDTYLFSGTIKENIRYGKLEAADEEIIAASVMANADAFIKHLPKQYDTLLSENGGNLSQGQRQLLAIARVILAKPAILILDEATSSIDTRTELHIQDALLKIMHGRTSFIVAHRLNTIREADTIMVIDHGEIIEEGSHDSLIHKKGIYYHMFSNQFK